MLTLATVTDLYPGTATLGEVGGSAAALHCPASSSYSSRGCSSTAEFKFRSFQVHFAVANRQNSSSLSQSRLSRSSGLWRETDFATPTTSASNLFLLGDKAIFWDGLHAFLVPSVRLYPPSPWSFDLFFSFSCSVSVWLRQIGRNVPVARSDSTKNTQHFSVLYSCLKAQ